MQIRYLMIGAAVLSLGAASFAEPAKPATQQPAQPASQEPEQPANRPAQVMLASAEQQPTPLAAADQRAPAPAKRRAVRVTTCRCGDQASDH
jgi:hypothetical protein